MRRILFLLPLLAACADAGGGDAARRESAGCRVRARDVTLPEQVHEASGIAFSRTLPGVLWTHNDSGNRAELFGVGMSAGLRATLPVPASPLDWEDLAVGPCPGAEGSCVYLADTGDLGRKDRPVELLVAPEPGARDAAVGAVRRFAARFPDGRTRDTEALFVLPDGGVFLVTKGSGGPVELFRWPTPLREGAPATLQSVRNLGPEPDQPGDRVTGASASPDGRFVALRTYSMLSLFRTGDLLGAGGPLHRMDLVPLQEPQGEGVALADDGTVALVSEGQGHSVPGMLSILQCPLE
jgi:hypothetical protein